MILALVLALLAGAALNAAAVLQGQIKMASAIDQVGAALAGAHSAAFEQLKADIEKHVAKEAADAATIADLTAKLAAAAALVSVDHEDVDLQALDALLNPPAPVVEPTPEPTPEPAAS